MIVFVCQDAGPAKYLLEVQKMLSLPSKVLASNLARVIFRESGVDPVDDLEIILDASLIITGTSLGFGIEKQIIQKAKENNIKTVSVIEHWSNYSGRFFVEGDYMYPDWIILNDQLALNQAIRDGLPKDKLIVGGNILLEKLIKAPSHHSNSNSKKILFISEELTSLYQEGYEDYGYDQFETLSDLRQFIPTEYFIEVKLHPEESPNAYRQRFGDIFKYHKNLTLKEIEEYEYVIGMKSMLLLELGCQNFRVFSYQPIEQNEFIGVKLGLVEKLSKCRLMEENWESLVNNRPLLTKNLFQGSKNKLRTIITKLYENNSHYSG
jgi:hypothetical protein